MVSNEYDDRKGSWILDNGPRLLFSCVPVRNGSGIWRSARDLLFWAITIPARSGELVVYIMLKLSDGSIKVLSEVRFIPKVKRNGNSWRDEDL